MRQVKFVKYNKMRQDQFQIKTTIYEEAGSTFVEKAAILAAGYPHIRSFKEKYESIRGMNPRIKVLKPKLQDGTMTYPYIQGVTLSEQLTKTASSRGEKREELITRLKDALDLVFDIKADYHTEFVATERFREVFGTVPDFREPGVSVANIDALFDNILVTDEGYLCLDYEWVFDFPVPISYLHYRNLLYFFQKYNNLMGYDQLVDFLKEFGIGDALAAIYAKMELSFQEYVHGKNHESAYLNRYVQPNIPFSRLLEAEIKEITNLERVYQLQDEVEDKNRHIRAMQETQRLTANHAANLEAVVGILREDVSHKEEELVYLRQHEGFLSKSKRNLKARFNQRFPVGSKKRKLLGYTKRTFLHPIKSGKLYFTSAGRNLIRGDFSIGAGYLEHGKLVFPHEDNPAVSIIIPVFNQVHYTYACLVSILANTTDVSYEIIIADDVSTDATANLKEYTSNIGISRNRENLGFLKNCNNAARHARGRYVMFLNNDTQVTPGWLKALVDLIESDAAIGMVGSKLVYPDGRLQEAGGIIWSDGSGWNYGRLDDPDKAEYNYVKDVDYISGAAILLSKSLWEEIGGFDERFAPAYCEDSDLAFEVRKRGKRVVYQPLSVVIHYEGISNGTDVNGTGLKRYQVENSEKLKAKWSQEFKNQCYNDGNPNPFLARERGQGKPVILFVDHYVPTFDKDAGSKTTYQYIKMFIRQGYHVKFLGDNYLREEPYTTTLLQMGVEVLYGPEYQTGIWDWIQDNKDYITVAYLNRPHIATKYIDFIKEHTDIKIIYYGHDLHFLREMREYELTGDEQKKRDAQYWRTTETALMYKADMSYYPSYIERDAIKAIDEDIQVKAITAYVYESFLENPSMDFTNRSGLLFVGGFAHPPNADGVLWFAREVYPRIKAKIDIPFYIVGSKVTAEIQALDGDGIEVKGFVSDEELERLYLESRVVVVPLRYGAGVKGKVVEALYYGAPIVSTSVGAEGIPEADDTMIVRDDPEAFAQAVTELYGNQEELAGYSGKALELVKRYYSLKGAWDIISNDFTVVK